MIISLVPPLSSAFDCFSLILFFKNRQECSNKHNCNHVFKFQIILFIDFALAMTGSPASQGLFLLQFTQRYCNTFICIDLLYQLLSCELGKNAYVEAARKKSAKAVEWTLRTMLNSPFWCTRKVAGPNAVIPVYLSDGYTLPHFRFPEQHHCSLVSAFADDRSKIIAG